MSRRHPPQGQARIRVQVHAPVDVRRPPEPFQESADEADDRGRREGDDGVEPREQQGLEHSPGVEAQVVGHPGPGAATPQRGRGHSVDPYPFVDLRGGRLRLAGLVAAPGAQDVTLVALLRHRFGQVGQVLGRRGMIGPVILIDEQDPLAGAFRDGSAPRMRRGRDPPHSGIDPDLPAGRFGPGDRGQAASEPASMAHRFAPWSRRRGRSFPTGTAAGGRRRAPPNLHGWH